MISAILRPLLKALGQAMQERRGVLDQRGDERLPGAEVIPFQAWRAGTRAEPSAPVSHGGILIELHARRHGRAE